MTGYLAENDYIVLLSGLAVKKTPKKKHPKTNLKKHIKNTRKFFLIFAK